MIIIGTKEEIEAMIEDSCPYPYPMPMNSCNNDCRACWNRSASIVIIRPEKVGTVEKALADRPHGEWISHYEYCKKHDCIPSGLIAFWWCNKCEQGVEIPTNFCPNCGADMRKEGDRNDG